MDGEVRTLEVPIKDTTAELLEDEVKLVCEAEGAVLILRMDFPTFFRHQTAVVKAFGQLQRRAIGRFLRSGD